MFNNLRFLVRLSPEQRALLGMGTTGNEALHQRINRWSKDYHTFYSTSIELDLGWFQFAALRAHNSAMYRPTLTQLTEGELLVMLSRHDGIGAEDWEEIIKHPPTPMPLYRRRLELTDKVASRKRLASEVGPVAAAQQVLRARGVVVPRSKLLLQKSEARAAR